MADGFKDKDKKFHPTNGSSKGVSKDSVKDDKDTLKTPKKKELKVEEEFDINSSENQKKLEDIIDKETEKRLEALDEDDDAFVDLIDDSPHMLDDVSYSRLLKESDDIAYRTGLNDYVDGILTDMENDFISDAEIEAEEKLEGHEKDKNYDEKLSKMVDDIAERLREEKDKELTDEPDQYNEALDETPAEARDFNGGVYRVLKEVDPIMLHEAFNDWQDGERDRVRDDVGVDIDEEESVKKGHFVEE